MDAISKYISTDVERVLQINLNEIQPLDDASMVICCIPFLVAAIILYIVKSKTKHLPPWIHVEEGEISRFSVGSLCIEQYHFDILLRTLKPVKLDRRYINGNFSS
jgi:hypothetical protein